MAKYLLHVSYTQGGMKGVMSEGGTSRRTMVEKLAQNMGGASNPSTSRSERTTSM